MIRAIHARAILSALSSTAAEGEVFYALNRCVRELDAIVENEAKSEARKRPLDDMELSVRSRNALVALRCATVGDVEALFKQGDAAILAFGKPYKFGKHCMREVRELLNNIGLSTRSDP